jgi:hypothetical protein
MLVNLFIYSSHVFVFVMECFFKKILKVQSDTIPKTVLDVTGFLQQWKYKPNWKFTIFLFTVNNDYPRLVILNLFQIL